MVQLDSLFDTEYTPNRVVRRLKADLSLVMNPKDDMNFISQDKKNKFGIIAIGRVTRVKCTMSALLSPFPFSMRVLSLVVI